MMVPQATPESNAPLRQIETFRSTTCSGQVDSGLRARLEPLLAAADPEAWREVLTDLVEVKRSTVRTILRATLAGGQAPLKVHIKLFRPVRLSDRARDALGGSRADRELRNLLAAQDRGLPAVRPLAAGTFVGSFGSRSFLVTETVPDAQPLPPGPVPAPVADAAGRLLRQVHDAGMLAPDLHPGNALLLPGDGPPELVLVDLTNARFGAALDQDDRARGLAFFCQGLDGGAADPDAAPLLAGYGGDEPITPELLQRAAQLGRAVRHRALSSWGRRAMRPCRQTEAPRRQRGQPRWFRHRTGDSEGDAALHRAAEELMPRLDDLEPLKSGRRGGVYVTDDLVVKTREPGAAKRLFRAAYWLIFAGVPTAPTVALCLHGGRGLVFSRRLPGPTLLEELGTGKWTAGELARTARSLGDSVGRLHAHGLRNRDLKLDNLLRDPETGVVRMLDLDGVRRKAPSDSRGQGADLGRLLAAFRFADEPGDARTVRAFVVAYLRARERLLAPRVTAHTWTLAAERAGQWAAAHAPR